MASTSLMVHRATIQRNTPQDVSGKVSSHWAAVATDVPCLVQESAGGAKQMADGRTVKYDAIGFFPITTDLRPRAANPQWDVIVLTTPAWLAGTTYRVKLVHDESGMGDHLTALLEVTSPVAT